jgi:CRP-like cAMP-binding protein
MTAEAPFRRAQRLGLLESLTPSQKRLIEEAAREIEVLRGRRIYRVGDPADRIFLLQAGIVRISTGRPPGRDSILAFVYPGDLVGELALVDESPRDHLATAHEDAVLYEISRDRLLAALRRSPAFAYQAIRLMASRSQQYRARVEALLQGSAPARIAHVLIELATAHGVRDSNGVLVPLRLSQREIGRLVGFARETVNTVLRDFHRRGLVEAHRYGVRINDLSRLRSIFQSPG